VLSQVQYHVKILTRHRTAVAPKFHHVKFFQGTVKGRHCSVILFIDRVTLLASASHVVLRYYHLFLASSSKLWTEWFPLTTSHFHFSLERKKLLQGIQSRWKVSNSVSMKSCSGTCEQNGFQLFPVSTFPDVFGSFGSGSSSLRSTGSSLSQAEPKAFRLLGK